MGAMQLLNYGDPVVGYRGPGGASYTQLRGPSGRLQGPRGASYSIIGTQWSAIGTQGGASHLITGAQWSGTGAQWGEGASGASHSITGTQWSGTGAPGGGQLLNYRDPVVGFRDPWGPVTQLRRPSGRL